MHLDGFDSIADARKFVQDHRAKNLLICDRDVVIAEREGVRKNNHPYHPDIDARSRFGGSSCHPSRSDIGGSHGIAHVSQDAGYDAVYVNGEEEGHLVRANAGTGKIDYEAMSGQD